MAHSVGGKTPSPKINFDILRSSAVLLHMEYKPSELARHIRVNVKTIHRSYIPAGLPHRRDTNGNIWIVGTAFNEWARTAYHQHKESHPKLKLKEDEAYCFKCRGVIQFDASHISNVRVISNGRKLLNITCPNCGTAFLRIAKRIPDDQPR
jgi:hypothetical protein